MDLKGIVKWIVVIAIAVAVWNVGLPWAKRQNFGGTSASSTGRGGDSSCTRSAESASSAWGGGIIRFINPPYDMNAWASFKSDVDSEISSAESQCSCTEESCVKTRLAMTELRAIVSEADNSIRNGSAPPEDLVQRQERIDNLIEEGAALVRAGK
jgi:hypothetical protein